MSEFEMTEEEKKNRLDLLLAADINPEAIPQHIAIIMDGNGLQWTTMAINGRQWQ